MRVCKFIYSTEYLFDIGKHAMCSISKSWQSLFEDIPFSITFHFDFIGGT